MLTKARATQLCTCGYVWKRGYVKRIWKLKGEAFMEGQHQKHQSLFTFWPTAYFLCFFLKKVQWAGGRNLNMFISKDPITHLWAWHIPAPCLPILLENVHMWEPTAQLLWPLLRHFLQANMLKFKYVHFNKSPSTSCRVGIQSTLVAYPGLLTFFYLNHQMI